MDSNFRRKKFCSFPLLLTSSLPPTVPVIVSSLGSGAGAANINDIRMKQIAKLYKKIETII